MATSKKRGRPAKATADARGKLLQVRVQESEKAGFEEAAGLAGLELSAWVRERLRTIAKKELAEYGKTPKFLKK
jgi:hypothetical protein